MSPGNPQSWNRYAYVQNNPLSEEEYAQLETAAQAGGCTLGEWCREVVLASGQEANPTGPSGAEAQALMAELVALRAILLNVLFKLANGEKPTAEEMQRLIDRADADKLKKALRRRSFRTSA